MKIIVGLGNPGKQYIGTRHNLGFMVLDQLAADAGQRFTSSPRTQSEICKFGDLLLCKPQTYMNNSGLAVRATLEYYKLSISEQLDNLYVVHDDLDLRIGSHKVQRGTGPKAHNGLLSLYDHLGTNNFWHVRVGVDNRGVLRSRITPSDYVLQPFTLEEQPVIEKEIAVIVAELNSNV